MDARPRRSTLAWCAFLVGVAPTGCGQLVAPLLAVMAWLEIRSASRPMRGHGLALAGVVVSVAWLGLFAWAAQWAVEEQERVVVQRDQHAAACAESLRRVAAGWTEARVSDPWGMQQLRPDEVAEWLLEQAYVTADDLCCPAAAAAGETACTLRFAEPLPPDVIPPGRCIMLYEDRARHHRDRGRGRHVLYADGHVDWLTTPEFRDALEAQQKAAADAARK